MKIVRIRDHFDTKFKEYVVGSKQLASRGTYLIMGEMEEGEVKRIGPGEGHEEILSAVRPGSYPQVGGGTGTG